MLGTVINAIAVIVGSVIGLTIGRFYTEEMRDITIKGIGLVTMALAFQMALQTKSLQPEDYLILIFSVVFGGITGIILSLEARLESVAEWLKEKTKSKESTFIEGFIVATIIFETGPMSILGAINDGLKGDIGLLLTKSALDGFVAIAFASTLGSGVLFSFISVLVYQGTITLLAGFIQPFIPLYTEQMISALGGILIIGIGIKLLDIKEMPVANYIPSLFWVIPLSQLVLVTL